MLPRNSEKRRPTGAATVPPGDDPRAGRCDEEVRDREERAPSDPLIDLEQDREIERPRDDRSEREAHQRTVARARSARFRPSHRPSAPTIAMSSIRTPNLPGR